MTCDAMLETKEFRGSCCSLSDHPVTGNCVVTVSNGTCGWSERCATGCGCSGDEGGFVCVVPYTRFTAQSEEACPASSYDTSGTECTTPVDMKALCSTDTATDATDAPTVAPSTTAVAASAVGVGAGGPAESSTDCTFSRLGLAIVVAATATLVAEIAF
jgi:hypothetical protein